MTDYEPEQPATDPGGGFGPDTPPIPTPVVADAPIVFGPQPPAAPEPLTGSYALGALAGNPLLGPPAGAGYGAPPRGPALPYWSAPAMPPPPAATAHPVRNAVAVVGAVALVLAAGAGIGHAAWKNGAVSPSNSQAAGSSGAGSGGSGSGGSGQFGSGPSGFGGFGSGGSPGSTTTPGPRDVSSIAAKVDPGLVDIDTSLGYQSEQAAGTGIVLTPSGEILTNNHVIDGATTISVTDVGNGKTYSASVVGYDRTRDIAVLQLHNASNLQTATMGNSSSAAVGENVVGIGNAGGTGGTPSAAGGTITALSQSITASDEGDASSEQLTGLIETNADIQAGDSGGPLVNASGQVLGIDTAASAGFSFQSQGDQGYAIPINSALTLARQIEAGNGTATVHIGATAFLGVEIDESTNGGNGGGSYGGYEGGGGTVSGAPVASVITSSPAQEAGLAQGDVITSLNGQNIGTPSDLTTALEPFHPGDKVTIGWTDDAGNSQSATVQLTSGPPQ